MKRTVALIDADSFTGHMTGLLRILKYVTHLHQTVVYDKTCLSFYPIRPFWPVHLRLFEAHRNCVLTVPVEDAISQLGAAEDKIYALE